MPYPKWISGALQETCPINTTNAASKHPETRKRAITSLIHPNCSELNRLLQTLLPSTPFTPSAVFRSILPKHQWRNRHERQLESMCALGLFSPGLSKVESVAVEQAKASSLCLVVVCLAVSGRCITSGDASPVAQGVAGLW